MSRAAFAGCAGHAGERAGQLGDAAPLGVPRRDRRGQPERAGEPLQHRHAVGAVARQRARRRRRAGPPAGVRARGAAGSRRRRARVTHVAATSPNVVGTACCSSVRPIIGVARWVAASVAGPVGGRGRRSPRDGVDARAGTSIAAVSRMSWLVAPAWTSGGGRRPDRGPQRLHQRDDRVAADGGGRPDGVDVEPLGPALLGDGPGVVGAGAAGVGQGPGQRRLGVEHGLEPGRRRRSASQRRAARQHGVEQRRRPVGATGVDTGHASASDIEEDGLVVPLEVDVEAVARRRSAPATSVARRRRLHRRRTGSAALAAASSPK